MHWIFIGLSLPNDEMDIDEHLGEDVFLIRFK
jgi:hypothetical protein